MNEQGVDLSNNNTAAPADWSSLGFVIAKASEGLGFVDRTLTHWATMAAAAGATFGAYHFAHPDQNAASSEAAHFAATVRAAGVDIAAAALDVETYAGRDPLAIMGAAALAAWVDRWCELAGAALEVTPLVYVNRSYLTALAPHLGDHPIWLATLDGHPHTTTYAGRPVTIEQWGIVDGIDRDIAWRALPPPPGPQPTPEVPEVLPACVYTIKENGAAILVYDGRLFPLDGDSLPAAMKSCGQTETLTITLAFAHALGLPP